jgi:DUF1680 family protein
LIIRMPWERTFSAGKSLCRCCVSSGPRGIALVPTFAITTDADGVVLNVYDAGKIAIAVDPATPHDFNVKLRLPDWCAKSLLRVNGQPAKSWRCQRR